MDARYIASMDATSICLEAEKINVERQQQYGSPVQDFNRTAALLTAIGFSRTDDKGETRDIVGADIAEIMLMVKMSRLSHEYKRDTVVDIAGYANTLGMLKEAGA